MTSFETVAIIVLIILAIAIVILKSWKNYNDGNEANDEEIKGYVFEGIRDVMSTIEVISGRTVEDTKKYVTEETVKKLTKLREESGIKFNLSEGTLTELITAVIDNNFGSDIDEYVKECEICGKKDCACDEIEEDNTCENTDTVEPETEEVLEEDEPVNEESFDTLKDEEGNEVEVPAGDLKDEPVEIETEPVEEVIEPVEETPVEKPVEEAVEPTEEVVDSVEDPVEETTEEEVVEEPAGETEVHTTESCTCIECMTKPQIKAWAADHDIFVSSNMLKADMIEKVKTEFEDKTATK